MNCMRLTQVLDGYLDGELDRATGEEIEEHLAHCPACTTARSEREALRQLVRAEAPRFSAPASLKQTVQQSLAHPRNSAVFSAAGGAAGGVARGMRIARGPTWLQAAALMMVVALLGVGAGYRLALPLPDSSLAEHVVASHIASLSDAHRLTEVSSLDRHQVKPWFQGKLDFSPVVRDLSADGFALLGARLDHVGDRQAAAIVYRLRNHTVNLFVWRARNNEAEAFALSSVRGFGVATWSGGGLGFAAVSDAEPRELERFARLVQSPQS
jgi:anti-sigma factor RsiW